MITYLRCCIASVNWPFVSAISKGYFRLRMKFRTYRLRSRNLLLLILLLLPVFVRKYVCKVNHYGRIDHYWNKNSVGLRRKCIIYNGASYILFQRFFYFLSFRWRINRHPARFLWLVVVVVVVVVVGNNVKFGYDNGIRILQICYTSHKYAEKLSMRMLKENLII